MGPENVVGGIKRGRPIPSERKMILGRMWLLTVPPNWPNFSLVKSTLHLDFYFFCARSGAPSRVWWVDLLVSGSGSVWLTL